MVVEAAAAAGPVASDTQIVCFQQCSGTSCLQAVVAVVLVPAVVLQVLADRRCMDYGRHYWQPAMPLVLAPYTPGAARGVDCTTPRLGMPWCLWAAKGQDRRKAAWGPPGNLTKPRFEEHVHSARHQTGIR